MSSTESRSFGHTECVGVGVLAVVTRVDLASTGTVDDTTAEVDQKLRPLGAEPPWEAQSPSRVRKTPPQ